MAGPLLRIVLTRAILAALPFAAWWLWARVAERTGRPMGSTPWPWLTAAGAVIVGLSLMFTAVFHSDNRAEMYVPGETAPDGHVTPGHFEKKASPAP